MNIFQENLKRALALNNMKQVDLSNKTGIPTSAISSYVSGKYLPKNNNIDNIAKVLDVGYNWLTGNILMVDDSIPRYKEEKLIIGISPLVQSNAIQIGERIKKIRLQKNMNIEEFSSLLNVDSDDVNHWEHGYTFPNRKSLNKIAKLGNTTVEKLLHTPPKIDVVESALEQYFNEIAKFNNALKNPQDEATQNFVNKLNELASQIDTSSPIFQIDTISTRLKIIKKQELPNSKHLDLALEEISELRKQLVDMYINPNEKK